MQTKIHKTFAFTVFIVFSLVPALWLLWINLAEIIDRANGRYTFFAQVATLSDHEAILYCSCWALLFIFLCYLSARSLIKEKYDRSIIFALIVFFTAILSVYIDTLFYSPPI
jgi:hypothetical protein